MLNDIVTRLRILADFSSRHSRPHYMLSSAADEIERLRKRIAELEEELERLHDADSRTQTVSVADGAPAEHAGFW